MCSAVVAFIVLLSVTSCYLLLFEAVKGRRRAQEAGLGGGSPASTFLPLHPNNYIYLSRYFLEKPCLLY